MSFFEITEQDLQDGKAKFNGGETPTMTIASIQKKDIKGNNTIIIECVVLDGANAGLKYSEFFRIGSDGGKKALGIFLTAFMTAKEAAAMTDPNVLVNKQFSSEFVSDGKYVNMRKVKAISNVPAGMGTPTEAAATPQSEAIGQPVPQAGLSKGLF